RPGRRPAEGGSGARRSAAGTMSPAIPGPAIAARRRRDRPTPAAGQGRAPRVPRPSAAVFLPSPKFPSRPGAKYGPAYLQEHTLAPPAAPMTQNVTLGSFSCAEYLVGKLPLSPVMRSAFGDAEWDGRRPGTRGIARADASRLAGCGAASGARARPGGPALRNSRTLPR